uniref:proline-rich transmembrane protein 4-like n=1 Tax=Myxine glutinosa TaxID=7769 RepID=UPI00358F4823
MARHKLGEPSCTTLLCLTIPIILPYCAARPAEITGSLPKIEASTDTNAPNTDASLPDAENRHLSASVTLMPRGRAAVLHLIPEEATTLSNQSSDSRLKFLPTSPALRTLLDGSVEVPMKRPFYFETLTAASNMSSVTSHQANTTAHDFRKIQVTAIPTSSNDSLDALGPSMLPHIAYSNFSTKLGFPTQNASFQPSLGLIDSTSVSPTLRSLHIYVLGLLFLILIPVALTVMWQRWSGRVMTILSCGLLVCLGVMRAAILLPGAYNDTGYLGTLVAIFLYDTGTACLGAAFVATLNVELPPSLVCNVTRVERLWNRTLACFMTVIFALAFAADVATSVVGASVVPVLSAARISHSICIAFFSIILLVSTCPGPRILGFKCAMDIQNKNALLQAMPWPSVGRIMAALGGFFLLNCAIAQVVGIANGCVILFDAGPQSSVWWAFHSISRVLELLGAACIFGFAYLDLPIFLPCLKPPTSSSKLPNYNWDASSSMPPTVTTATDIVTSSPTQGCWEKMAGILRGHWCEDISGGARPADVASLGISQPQDAFRSSNDASRLAYTPSMPASQEGCPKIVANSASLSELDFLPPSPVDLQHSIEEALFARGLLRGRSLSTGELTLSLMVTTNTFSDSANLKSSGPSRQSRFGSLRSLGRSHSTLVGDGSSVSSLSWWRGLSSGSLTGRSSSPGSSPGSPDKSGGRRRCSFGAKRAFGRSEPKPPLVSASTTHSEFVQLCRRIDQLSVGSDTIDL